MRISLSVLVIIDDQEMLNYFQTLLICKWKYQVTVARGGGQALELLREKLQPDLILLDICMPNIDGLEVLRQCDHFRKGRGKYHGKAVEVLKG